MIDDRKARRIKKARKIAVVFLFILIFAACGYSAKLYFMKKPTKDTSAKVQIQSSNLQKQKEKKTEDAIPEEVLNFKGKTYDSQNNELRKFPYPYNAMLALCSDIDDAALADFKAYHQFLNTKEKTPYGEGMGLDVGDSMWLYMADTYSKPSTGQGHGSDAVMTYFKGIDTTKKNNADEIACFTKCGWIDCIHTFGDFSNADERKTLFTKELAVQAYNTLKSIGFSPKVWINHGNRSNKQNFGAANTSNFMSYQQGDNPKSAYYHTDITMSNGIKYVWNSLNSNSFGQDSPLYEITLRDGKKIWGFPRYTNTMSRGKIDWNWTPGEIHRQLTEDNLNSIVNKKQYSIVAQHLGVDPKELFKEKNIRALRLLKQYEDNKKILVARTSRLLDYADAHKYVIYDKIIKDEVTYINIVGINDPIFKNPEPKIDDVRGLTFYTDNPEKTVLLINNAKVSKDEIQTNPKDETGKDSISIRWFTPDYTDYTNH